MSARPADAGRWLMLAAVGVVVASVVVALFVMDPPSRQRAERLDQLRVTHLQLLSQRIDDHALVHGRLPQRLSVVDSGPGPAIVDPVTGRPYVYESTGEGGYRLCADFDTTPDPALERDDWRHGAGRHCFDRQPRKDARRGVPVRPPQ